MSLFIANPLQLLSSHRLACHSNRRYILDRLDFQTHENVFHLVPRCRYFASSIATSAVRLSGLLVVSLSTEDGVEQSGPWYPSRRPIRYEYLYCCTCHEGCLQVCWSAACFCRLPVALSWGFNNSFTSARVYPDRCRPLFPAVVGLVMLGVPFIKRPLCYHSNIIFWESVVWFRSSLLLPFACMHRPARQQVIGLVSARA